jgi:hypothetical protein
VEEQVFPATNARLLRTKLGGTVIVRETAGLSAT